MQETKYTKPDLEFCKKEKLSIKQEIVCDQNNLHGSMLDNPLGFILFYVFSILLIAGLFQLSQRKIKKKEQKDK